MKFKKAILLILLTATTLTGCANQNKAENSSSKSIALITDGSGINDHSFNQSAWEGFKDYGQEYKLNQGRNGYQYFQSKNSGDFSKNIAKAVKAKYQTIFGIGYKLKDDISTAAKRYPNKNFVIIDDVIKNHKNVASVTFRKDEGAYLAGVVAASESKTGRVGFIGGSKSGIINSFSSGFTQGVQDQAKKMHKKITVFHQYVGNFTDTNRAKSIASGMYGKGADIIFHAAGGAGNGLFEEAKFINQARPAKDKVWVIGVDADQSDLGNYFAKGGQEANFVLTSVITGVNVATKDIASQAYQDNFPAGKKLVYGLRSGAVSLLPGQIDPNAWKNAQIAKQKILAGKIKIKN